MPVAVLAWLVGDPPDPCAPRSGCAASKALPLHGARRPAPPPRTRRSRAEGAARETWEEAGARVNVVAPYVHFDIPSISQAYILFRAELAPPYSFAAQAPESLDAALFEPSRIPWDEVPAGGAAFLLLGRGGRRGDPCRGLRRPWLVDGATSGARLQRLGPLAVVLLSPRRSLRSPSWPLAAGVFGGEHGAAVFCGGPRGAAVARPPRRDPQGTGCGAQRPRQLLLDRPRGAWRACLALMGRGRRGQALKDAAPRPWARRRLARWTLLLESCWGVEQRGSSLGARVTLKKPL